MRTVSYADEHFRTSDAIADAILRYSMVLAHGSSSDVVRIPVIVETEQTWAEIIVGPASQITTLEVQSDSKDDDLDDAEVVADIQQRADDAEARYRPERAVPEEVDPPAVPYIDEPE